MRDWSPEEAMGGRRSVGESELTDPLAISGKWDGIANANDTFFQKVRRSSSVESKGHEVSQDSRIQDKTVCGCSGVPAVMFEIDQQISFLKSIRFDLKSFLKILSIERAIQELLSVIHLLTKCFQ